MAVSVEEKREAALFVWYTMPSIHREGGTDLGDILEPHGLHFLEPALPQDAQHLKSTHDRGGEMELVGQSVARYSKCFLPKTQIGRQINKQTNKQTNTHTSSKLPVRASSRRREWTRSTSKMRGWSSSSSATGHNDIHVGGGVALVSHQTEGVDG